MSDHSLNEAPRGTLALAAAVTVPVLLSAMPSYLAARADGHPLAAWLTAVWQVSTWMFWAAAAIAILPLRRRFPVPGASAVHVIAALALALLHATLLTISIPLLSIPLAGIGAGAVFARALGVYLPFDLLTYAAILLVAFGAGTQQRLAQARLDALTMQVQPHFLFNSLNAAAVLVRRQDHAGALGVLTALGTLLRSVLDATAHERSLGEEIAFVESYLAIQSVRFPDRFEFAIEADGDARRAVVPTLLLQPLVENAIVHGIAHRPQRDGRVEIHARREEDRLRIEVRDNGGGFAQAVEGIGLRNSRARLVELHGSRGTLVIASAAGEGTRVTIRIPYRTTPRVRPRA